jgi:hypothetical protein
MANFVTIRRWALREGANEDEVVRLVDDEIVPAYRRQPGCLSLNLLRVHNSPSFLAITYWENRTSYESWAGDAGQQWRDDYRPTLERWLGLMVFQEEMEADLLIVG